MRFRCILSVALALVFVFLLTGCTNTQSVDLTGEWVATVDISDSLADVPGVEEPLSDIAFDLVFVFGDDGSFEAIIDQYSVEVMVDKLLDIVAQALSEKAQLNGISEQELRKLLESAVDMDQIVGSVQDSLQNGYYVYADGVIYLSSEPNPTAETAQEHLMVTISGDTLTVNQIVSDSFQHDPMLSGLLPLTFHKQ